MILGSVHSYSTPEFIGLPRKRTADSQWALSLDNGRLGNVFHQQETAYPCTLRATYRGNISLAVRTELRIYRRENEEERTIGYEVREWTAVPDEETVFTVDLTPYIDRNAIYYIDMRLFRADGTFETEDLFSVTRLLPPSANDRRLGMSVHFPYNGLYTKDLIPHLASLGVGALRTDFGWVEAEKEKGVIAAPAYWDEFVDMANAYDIEILGIIDYGNPFYDDGGAPYTEEGLAAYERYCRYLATHYKGRVKHFEIWNEYNINYANPGYQPPETYAKMLQRAYPALKECNPDAYVVVGGMCGIHFEWMRRVMRQGSIHYTDALSLHPYCRTFPDDGQGQMLRNINDMQQVGREFGRELPVWITEMGWSTYRDSGGITRETQAADAVRMFALGMNAGADNRYFWYDFINDEFDMYEREHQFGITEAYDATVRMAPKEAYVALSALNSKLGRSRPLGETRLGKTTRLFAMDCPNAEKPVCIFWSTDEPETLRVQAEGSSAVLTDMYGNSRTLAAQDGYVTIVSGVLPQYIEGVSLPVAEAAPTVQLSRQAQRCVAGEGFPVQVEAFDGSCCVEVPDGFTVAPSLNADNTFMVTVSPVAVEKIYNGRVYCRTAEGLVCELPFTVEVVKPLETVVKPCSVNGQWCLSVDIINNSRRRTASGRFRITEPERWRRQAKRPDYDEMIRAVRLSESERYEVLPQQTQTLLFGAPAELGDGFHAIGTELLPDIGAAEYTHHRINFFGIQHIDTPPTIDGSVSREKWGEPQIVLTEKDFVAGINNPPVQPGFGAEVFLRWDEENFYLAARVKDAVHYQTCTCGDLWQDLWDGDGIQILLDPLRETRRDHMWYNEIGIALTSNTNEQKVWQFRTTYNRGEQLIPEVPRVIRREGDMTLYEVAFPWKMLLPEGVTAYRGKDFGIALGVNDNNGEGCLGRLSYQRGIGFWYDQEGYNPQLCGDMVLL